VTLFMKGIKRQNLEVPVKQATPLTPDMLAKMREVLLHKPTLVQWRTVWVAHMEFGLVLRYDDLKRLKVYIECMTFNVDPSNLCFIGRKPLI